MREAMKEQIQSKVDAKQRLTRDEIHYLYTEASLEDLQNLATKVRARFHNPQEATYLIMRIINYTNVCVAKCDYCAFYRLPSSSESYVLARDQIFAKIDEIIALGGDFVGFNGGFHPKLNIEWYQDLYASLRERYGDQIEFYGLTVAELMYLAKRWNKTYSQVAKALKSSGVRWITGGGAEILTNEFRERHSPLKYTADDYMQAQKDIIEAGVNTTATMVIGFDESIDERIEHLLRVRDLQDQTNGLFSFLTWTYKPEHTEWGGKEITQEEYLRHLAVCRLALDNIKHLRTSVLTQNENALKGLHFGANDFDIPLEDEVTQKAGAVINKDIKVILEQAKAQGFTPVFRPMAPSNQDARNKAS
ncbi:MAG: radical SAM protein [Deltaproteobacteria bacterium]|nr:radical SAM protein [Deltaproteobacteria bacterium]